VSGDTLYFCFGSYNDSGDSESIGGTLAVTDIEVIKNGSATVRATDSGYSLISDTGQVGDRVGLHRFSIQLFNTNDDATFYAEGSWYQVFVDSITVDGKTVRFWCGSFEVGTPLRDTGQANNLVWDSLTASHTTNSTFGKQLTEHDTGIRSWVASDTGLRAQLGWLDTGLRDTLADYDTGIRDFITDAKNELDTGGVRADLVAVTGDTGAAKRFFRSLEKMDTGGGDTGSMNRFARWIGKLDTGGDAPGSAASIDTGQIVNIIWNAETSAHATDATFGTLFTDIDTGIRDRLDELDTGIHKAISDADTGIRANLVAGSTDTGAVSRAVWDSLRADHVAAGSFGLDVPTDTGLRDTLADYDTGIRAILALADTGKIATAVWAGDTGLRDHISNVDTGIRDRLDELDTGIHKAISDADTGIRANLVAGSTDTGAVSRAVWDSLRADHVTDSTFGMAVADADTGIRQAISGIAAGSTDTGLVSQAVWNSVRTDHTTAGTFGQWVKSDMTAVTTDTGAARRFFRSLEKMDTGGGDTGSMNRFARFIAKLDTGGDITSISASVDTGQINNAVWNGVVSDHTTNGTFGVKFDDLDTGLRANIAASSASNVTSITGDTGAARRFFRWAEKLDTGGGDTGATNRFTRFVNKLDTGGDITSISASFDTGLVNRAVWDGQTSQHTTDGTYGVLMQDIDTGIRDRLDELDTGMRSWVASDTGLRSQINWLDTGLRATMDDYDTGPRSWMASDTGIRAQIGFLDTGLRDYVDNIDTGLRTTMDDYDTGIRDYINDAKNELDTGLRAQLNWVDTGIRDRLDEIDTGIHKAIQDADTGLRANFVAGSTDTGAVNRAVWDGILSDHTTDGTYGVAISDIDTGIRTAIAGIAAGTFDTGVAVNAIWGAVQADHATDGTFGVAVSDMDTGIRDRLDELDTGLRSWVASDTGLRAQMFWLDTGLRGYVENVDTGLRDYVDNIDTGSRAAISVVASQTNKLTFDTGNELQVDIRKVNNITVQGTGDTGTADTWRPV
jgi:hypothetical protein